MNGLNDSHGRWNNVQHAVTTWHHKFNENWHLDTQGWYRWESHTPTVNIPKVWRSSASAIRI